VHRVIAFLLTLLWATSVAAAPARLNDFTSADAVLRWINAYRTKPDPAAVPEAIRALSNFGAFKDPESAGVYIGFFAGILNANPGRAEEIVNKTLPLPAENQWVIVRAIAYSGLPDWKGLLADVADGLPARRVMVDAYLNGSLPTLEHLMFEKDPSWFEKVRRQFGFADKKKTRPLLAPSPEILDTLWGYYFATVDYRPIAGIIGMLPWSKHEDNVEKLTLGAMAKYTLASNAARDPVLLALLKRASLQQSKENLVVLNEVIAAAEIVDMGRIRKEALVAIDELKRKGPAYQREVAWWGRAGEFAIAGGCLAAAIAGQVELGLPCVVGGALSSAGLKFLAGQQ